MQIIFKVINSEYLFSKNFMMRIFFEKFWKEIKLWSTIVVSMKNSCRLFIQRQVRIYVSEVKLRKKKKEGNYTCKYFSIHIKTKNLLCIFIHISWMYMYIRVLFLNWLFFFLYLIDGISVYTLKKKKFPSKMSS